MRLFEVDQGSVRDVLSVLQGLANRKGQASELPFPVVMNILKPFGLGISTPDGLIALKNSIDPAGDVIKDIDTKTGKVTLNTKSQDPDQAQNSSSGQPAGPSVDAMAASNTDLTPNL